MKDKMKDLKKKMKEGINLLKDSVIHLRKDGKVEKEDAKNIVKRAEKLRDE